MYKIVVVDDELRQCRGLKNILLRQFEGYEIKDFTDSEAALSYIGKEEIKIVITDICMPDLDGLELTKKIKEKNRGVKIILLTGYADFEYARKALKLGAFDYLLKPMNPDKLKGVLEKAIQELEEEQILMSQHDKMQEQLNMTLPVYVENLLNQWVYGRTSWDELKEIEKIIPRGQFGFVIATKFSGLFKWQIGKECNEIKDVRNQLILWMKHRTKKGYHAMSFFSQILPETMITIIICQRDMPADEGCFVSSNWSLSTIKQNGKTMDSYGMDIVVGIGDEKINLFEEIQIVYRSAIEVLNYRFYFPNQKVLLAKEILANGTKKIGINLVEEAVLKDAIMEGNQEKACEVVEHLMRQHIGVEYPNPEHFMNVFDSLLRHLESSLYTKYRIKSEKSKEQSHLASSLEEYISYGKKSIKSMTEAIQKQQKNGIAEQIEAYLEEHYQEEISLENIAEYFHFTPTYFSGFIKEMTGKSFSKSLVEIRTRYAKEYLIHSRLKIYEIANEVGYHDVKYFNRVFKKSVGLTPIEYREKVKKLGRLK